MNLSWRGIFFYFQGGVAGYWLAGLQSNVDERLNLSQQKRVNLSERYRNRTLYKNEALKCRSRESANSAETQNFNRARRGHNDFKKGIKMEIGTHVKWQSQAQGSTTEKRGTIVRILSKGDFPREIAEREFLNHKRMFDGWSPPLGSSDAAFFVEVKSGPKAKLKLYMPNPTRLEKI